MTIAKDSITIIQDIDNFIKNIKNKIFGGTIYHSGDIPKFSGLGVYNTAYTSQTTYTALQNPEALPSGNLEALSKVKVDVVTQGKDDVCSAPIVFNVLKEMVYNLTRVRKFQSRWYHKTGDTQALMGTVEGKAVFSKSFSALPAYNEKLNSKCVGWTRSVNDSLQQISVPELQKDTIMSANAMTTFLNKLDSEWDRTYNNQVEYKLYSCHNNCHDNCHSSGRGRR